MGYLEERGSAGGCARVAVWSAAALLIATAGVLYGNARVGEAWHWCLTQDHEPDPRAAVAAKPTAITIVVRTEGMTTVGPSPTGSEKYISTITRM